MEKHDAVAKCDTLEITQTVTTSLVCSEARLKLDKGNPRSADRVEPTVVSLKVDSDKVSDHLKAVQHEVNAWISSHVTES